MNKTVLFCFSVVMCVILFFPKNASAQYSTPNPQFELENLSEIRLNPFNVQDETDFFSRGYGMEFIASELSIIGGSLLAGGVFVVGFLMAWGDNKAAGPIIIGSGLIALGTPALAGYFLHLAGRSYHPVGRISSAILGTYLGTILAFGTGFIFSPSGNRDVFDSISPFGLAVLPGLFGVLLYNTMPGRINANAGQALLNSNMGNFSLGLPALSLSPNPFSQGSYFTQISLMSVRF